MIKQIKVISTSLDSLGRHIVKFLRMGLDDVQEVESVAPFGFDSNPIKDMIAIHTTTGVSGESKVIGFINKDCIADVGESRIFSTDADGELQTFIHLKNDGTMEVGGDANFMVRFNELKSGFDALKADFNAHSHITTATIGATPTPGVIAPPTSPSTASIDSAKIDEIKTL